MVHGPGTGVGVGGLSAIAAEASQNDLSVEQVCAEVAAWSRLLSAGTEIPGHVMSFPYSPVIDYYQGVGRNHVAPLLVEELKSASELLMKLAAKEESWPLGEWLPSTFDQEVGGYDSYLCSALLEGVAEDDVAIDTLLVALVARLAVTETDAQSRLPDDRRQSRRTQACRHALERAADFAPKSTVQGDDPVEVLDRIPPSLRQVVDIAMLPTSTLHDEHMFIRSIQIFESVYRQVVRALLRALTAVEEADAVRAREELADAASRLEATPLLYRVVTTMPKEAFAVIRDYTNGRSAVQSRAYRQVEFICAPADPDPTTAGKIPRIEVPARTLQEAFAEQEHRMPAADARLLAEEMVRLDTAWHSMKRTHWGITLKIIGNVPGTGGTDGADYLKRTSEAPLFPDLER